MKEEEIRTAVLAALKTIAPELQPDEIQTDRPLRTQIDLDSMDWLNFLIGLHQRLHVDIPESDYGKLVTFDGILAYLGAKLA